MDQIIPILQSILTGSNLSLGLKLSVLFFGLASFIFLAVNLEKIKQWWAKQQTQAKEVADKQKMSDDNLVKNDQAKSDSKNIDDFLKGEK